MNYELALVLKNAGFPQPRSDERVSGKWFFQNGKENLFHDEDDYDQEFITSDIYIPTLSELIEACGKEFECLVHNTNVGIDLDREFWSAGTGKNNLKTDWAYGPTPEIAVARLYLAINKK